MIKSISAFFCAAVFLLLSACALHTKPINNPLSPRDECQSLQQRMAFINLNRTDQSQWQTQSEQLQLQRAYHTNGCHRIMDTSSSKKTKSKTESN